LTNYLILANYFLVFKIFGLNLLKIPADQVERPESIAEYRVLDKKKKIAYAA
jgi:hypothetical protein